MWKFFDYHYYRVAKFYFKRDGVTAITALISVSSIQVWIILNVLLFLEGLYPSAVDNFKYSRVIYFSVVIGVILYNKIRYKNKYLEYRNRWNDESKGRKKINGIIIILTILISWCLIFINGFIFHRFK